jgi:hypothetical protein
MQRWGMLVRLSAFALILATAAFRAPASAPEPCSCLVAHAIRSLEAINCAEDGACVTLESCYVFEGVVFHTSLCVPPGPGGCTEQFMEWCQ